MPVKAFLVDATLSLLHRLIETMLIPQTIGQCHFLKHGRTLGGVHFELRATSVLCRIMMFAAHQRNNVLKEMRLTNGAANQTIVIGIHYVNMEVV